MEMHLVASVEEVREIVEASDLDVNLEFFLREDASLTDASRFWGSCNYGGGQGTMGNPDLLFAKAEALEFVQRKLDRLRRWAAHANRKLNKVFDQADHIEAVLAAGGPGLPGGYESKEFRAGQVHLDINLHPDQLDEHIESLRVLMLEDAPGTPADDETSEALRERDIQEQRATGEFLHEYMKVKRDMLALLKYGLLGRIEILEQRFLREPTFMGCGSSSSESVPFDDIAVFPGEAK